MKELKKFAQPLIVILRWLGRIKIKHLLFLSLPFLIVIELFALLSSHKFVGNFIGRNFFRNQYFENIYELSQLERTDSPSGGSWGDYNNDGWQDLLVTGKTTKLYKNNGNSTFTDVTKESGLVELPSSATGVFGDYDNDGCLDLYVKIVNANFSNKLFHNNCNGSFSDVTTLSRLANIGEKRRGSGASWGDYDNDGFIDLYIANHGSYRPDGEYIITFEPNVLYHNNGDGTFTDVTVKAGVSGITNCVEPRYSWSHIKGSEGGPLKLSFQPIFFDYNDDGLVDLFIATDGGVNPLYRNNGDGTFVEVTDEVGICVYGSGMGVSIGDFDNSGTPDIYVTNVGSNYLWSNEGSGKFYEVAKAFGVSDSLSIGWGTSFLDFDNDGNLDLYIANGIVNDAEIVESGIGQVRLDKLYYNNGDNFENVSSSMGFEGDYPKEGLAIGDFNNDGFEDIFVLSAWRLGEDKSRLYRNSGNNNNWITIKLVGTKSNKDGIGAKVIVVSGGKTQTKFVTSGSSFLSQNSIWQTFGLGISDKIDKIEINWSSGIVQALEDIKVNQFLTIVES